MAVKKEKAMNWHTNIGDATACTERGKHRFFVCPQSNRCAEQERQEAEKFLFLKENKIRPKIKQRGNSKRTSCGTDGLAIKGKGASGESVWNKLETQELINWIGRRFFSPRTGNGRERPFPNALSKRTSAWDSLWNAFSDIKMFLSVESAVHSRVLCLPQKGGPQ